MTALELDQGAGVEPRHPGTLGILSMENEPRRRVVVTGVGTITPLGASVAKTWHPVIDGVSRTEDDGLYLEVAVRRR